MVSMPQLCHGLLQGTLMLEPTESEPKAELDRFCEAMISIRRKQIEFLKGSGTKQTIRLKTPPHPAEDLTDPQWNHCYSQETAFYPLDSIRQKKYWPPSACRQCAW